MPFRTGIKSWIPEGQNIYLRKEETTIAALLKQNGYQTCLSGKWHLNGGLDDTNHSQPQDHGFDHWLANHAFAIPNHKNPENFYRNGKALGPLKGFSAQIVVDEALGWIEDRDQSRPFFVYLSFNEPHSEIASPDDFNEMYSDYTEGEIDLENLSNRGPGEYYANITHLDYQVGRFLDRMVELDLVDNTLVIFTSDNGPVTTEWRYPWEVNMYGSTGGLRGRKADLFEGGIRVPCIIKYPGLVSPGTESTIPLHGYDLLPTICGLVGIDLPQASILDGVDFSPIFSGGSINRSNPLFWAYETRAYDDPAGYYFAARDGDWKFITDKDVKKTLLYNLKDDPYELKELSAEHPGRIEKMKGFVSRMYKSIQEDPMRPD